MMIDFTLGANSGGGTGISQLDAIVLARHGARVVLVEGPGITGADLLRLPFRRILVAGLGRQGHYDDDRYRRQPR